MGFGQVAAWSTITVDTIAERKRVVFRPSTAADTIRVGDLVCYNSDLAADWKELTSARAADDLNGSGVTTYAEGSQTYNARFLVVEKPASGNLHAYAGVVAVLGPERGGDGDTIEIFVPKTGAVVPVMSNLSCTVDSTVLTVANAAYEATSAGYPIGIAVETVDRSNVDGLVWMRMTPELFASQRASGVLSIPGTAAAKANDIRCSFAHTSGYSTNTFVYTTFTGTIAATGGGASVLAYLSVDGSITATTSYTRCILAQLNLSGTINGSNAHLTGLMAQLSGSPTFTACSKVAGLMVDLSLGVVPTSGDYVGIMISNNGLNQTEVNSAIEVYGNYGINELFSFQSCDGITGNFISNGGTGGAEIGITSGGDWKKIKIDIGGTTYYMLAMLNPSEVDMVS